jgi:DNA-binding Xre family transcriptional regulator
MSKKSTIEIIAENERLDLKELALKVGCNPQNMYDIKSGKAKSVSKRIAEKIIIVFPQYSKSWVMTGEGEMYNDSSGTAAIFNNQVGNGNQFTSTATVERFLDELSAQRELTKEAQQQLTKSQEQMDRLITIIEKLKD